MSGTKILVASSEYQLRNSNRPDNTVNDPPLIEGDGVMIGYI